MRANTYQNSNPFARSIFCTKGLEMERLGYNVNRQIVHTLRFMTHAE